MASAALDSVPQFKDRAKKIGVTDEVLQELIAANFDTFGKLCFAASSSPHQLDDAAVTAWMEATFANPLSPFQTACIRRLMFESQSMNIAELRSRVEPNGEAQVRKLPPAERAARAKAQEARLQGVVFTPETSPANCLVDLFVDMGEQGILTYLGPERCISRAQELQLSRKDKSIQVEADGRLRVIAHSKDPTCEVSSDTKLRAAWLRRSLAMDQAGLCSFIEIEKWVQHLFSIQAREVGFQSISVQQLISADKALFIFASEKMIGTLLAAPNQPKPLDAQIRTLMYANEVVQFQPKGGGKGTTPKGKRDGKTPETALIVPEGCVSKTVDGKPICFGFNRGTCRWNGKGKRCQRGFHVCWKKGCGLSMSAITRTERMARLLRPPRGRQPALWPGPRVKSGEFCLLLRRPWPLLFSSKEHL